MEEALPSRRYLAEFVGTFALVFCGTGAVIVNDTRGGALGHLGISLVFGLVVMAMIYSVGDISGAHLNPAVSLGFWLDGRLPGHTAAIYALSQTLGAVAASLVLRVTMPAHETMGATVPTVGGRAAFLLEVLLTFVLMFVILNVSTGAKEKGPMAGAAIGATVALAALFAGPLTGASMNPARSLGPALVSGQMRSLVIYLTAPFVGAIGAVLLSRCMRGFGVCLPREATPATPRDIELADEATLTHFRSWRAPMTTTNVLFLCTGNTARSQMAEAFLRRLAGDRFVAYSAGLEPDEINPYTRRVMEEIGYDLAGQFSKGVEEYMGKMHFGYLITVCANAEARCPSAFPGVGQRLHWNLDDPAAFVGTEEETLAVFRRVRDEVKARILGWLSAQGVEATGK